jgi:hypothetical protein
MSEDTEIVAEATSPTVEATEPELDGEALIDSELDSLFSNEEAAGKAPAPEEKVPAAEEPKPEESEEVVPEGLDEAQLEEWSKAETETPEIPADSEYLKDVVKVLPNREAVQYAIEAFQKQTRMTRAVESGNMAQAVEEMPEIQPLIQSVVQNYLAQNEEKIVQDWIDKNDPEKINPEVRALQAKFSALEAEKLAEQQQKAAQGQQASMRERTEVINTTVNDLFDTLKFTTEGSHRGVVADLFKIELSNDSELMQKAIVSDAKELKTILRKPLAAAIKRMRDFEKTIVRAPQTETTNVITQKGGVGADAEQDELDEASRFLASFTP